MAEAALVTIRRQVLEVDLHGTEAEGQALQRRLPRVCADVLSPAIEAALAGLATDGTSVHLDRLELDLALTSLDDFETDLADAVRRGIADQLRRRAPSAARAGSAGPRAGPAEQPSSAAGRSADEALSVFLRTGRLRWWFAVPPGQTLEAMVRDAWEPTGGPAARPLTAGPLRAALAAPVAQERLVAQFRPDFVWTVLRALSPELAVAVDQVEASLGGTLAVPAGRTFGRLVRQVAVAAAVAGDRPDGEALVRQAWTVTSAADRADPDLATAIELAWPNGRTPAALAVPKPPSPVPETPAAPATPSAPSAPANAMPRVGDEADADGLLVDSAGLILLHPFLSTFFTGLGVAAGDALVAPDRALALMHHLATGELVAPEHRLTLAKALCGVPLGSPCEADVGLTDSETTEATALLEAAVGHWTALRSTSPTGLRSEFLQRPGLLSTTAYGDWLLQVEGRTVDILLDQLPWGFSSFRLPWMSRLMMVEWQ